jgi:hypothetical protein
MTAGQELIQRIVERYYFADLPEDPELRLVVLRDAAAAEWGALPHDAKLAMAEELDDCEQVVAFAEQAPQLDAEDYERLDEEAVAGLTDVARREIPELWIPGR